MKTCESFEIALEMQRRGVLSAPESEAVEAHLSSCSSCRNYAALIGRTEHVMSLQAGGLNLSALDEKISRFIQSDERKSWANAGLGVVLLSSLAVIAALRSGEGLDRYLTWALLAALLMSALIFGRAVWVRRQWGGARVTETAVLEAYRKMLRAQIQQLNLSLGLVLVFSVRIAWLLAEHYARAPSIAIGFGALWLAIVGGTAWWRHKRLPALRSELNALSR